MKHQATFAIVITLLAGALLAALTSACNPKVSPFPTDPPGLANPASQNCIDQGGTLQIQERGDGGQYGVCYFEDNRQCEEWALFNNECPVGGKKITGYITDAAVYCVITGGEYTITDANADPEQGTCAFPSGNTCDVWEYWNGTCTK